jgi:hypothetical protein
MSQAVTTVQIVDTAVTEEDVAIAVTEEVYAGFAPAKPVEKVKYITNKELLAEIHKSKSSYCIFVDKKYAAFDAIVHNLDQITDELMSATKIEKARLTIQAEKARQREAGKKPYEIKVAEIDPQAIPTETIVFRVMTPHHLPLDPDRKRRGKGEEGAYVKTPFLPFKHFIIQDGQPVEVGRSHWIGTLQDGHFDMSRGQISHRLAVMFMMLVDRYSRRSNWRGYTYLDEMKSHALLQLSQIGLQFDESKSDNPFAFYTTTIKNCFTRVLNLEKKNQNIRDDILIMHGVNPSYTRQHENDGSDAPGEVIDRTAESK